MTDVNTTPAVGLVCRVLPDNILSEAQVREVAQSAAELVPTGRCVAFIWNTPHDWGSERPVEAWLNNALLRSQPQKNFIFFGNVVVRAYRDLTAAPTRTLVVMMFRRLGDKPYLRARTASANLLEESRLDTKAYSFTRDWANNVWHFYEKNVECSVISRLSSLCRWSDEKTLAIGVQDVVESIPGDLIPVAIKDPYISARRTAMTDLFLYDSAMRRKRRFEPINPAHVRMYVCGPTVYDFAHLGNARPAVVFDVLYRLLKRRYPKVTYVRNITDIDDKITTRSRETGKPIAAITAGTTANYHTDMAALNVLPPDVEPRATQHIAEMIALIERLIANGHAYVADGHVLFSVPSFPDYGKLSGRTPDELLVGARIDVAPYKRDPKDFVLWKPSDASMPGWDSPWGRGRPGWHIECSAMSWKHLGEEFDIHGGGRDLMFPHHENEVAQSVCAFPGHGFANYWLHNSMLLVDGDKMSKSLGNSVTVRDILAEGFWAGEALRLLLLRTHYRAVLDFTMEGLREAKAELDAHYAMLRRAPAAGDAAVASGVVTRSLVEWALEPLHDDLNTPLALARLRRLRKLENELTLGGSVATLLDRIGLGHEFAPGVAAAAFREAASVLGIARFDAEDWAQGRLPSARVPEGLGEAEIESAIATRTAAREARNWAEADRIRDDLKAQGIILEDTPDGTTWRRA